MMDPSAQPSPSPRWPRGLAVVLVLAAILRLWAIDFGLDVEKARPDEEFVVGKAVEMLESRDPNPHFFHYPSFLMYLNAALLGLLGPVADVDPRLVGRLLTVACGVGTVALVGLLGARLASAAAGLMAAGLVAVAYQHVRESHFATTDVPFNFLVTASVWLAVEGYRRRRHRLVRLAYVVTGLAMSTKYPGVLALVPVVFAGASLARFRGRNVLRETAIALTLSFASFALTSPYFFLDAEGARTSLAELVRETWGESSTTPLDPTFPFTFALAYGLGLPLLSLGAAGLLAGARRWPGLVLLAWFLPFCLVATLTARQFARYSFPLVLPLCLAAAVLIASLSLKRYLKGALFATAAIPTLWTAVSFNRVLAREDTRSLATSWIERNLPPGTKVQVSAGYGAPTIPPPYPARRVGSRLGAVRQGERDGFHHLVTHEHPALYRFSRVDGSLAARLESSELLERFDPFRPGRHPGLYDELDAFYVPYADPGSVERPGPIVSVWKLSP